MTVFSGIAALMCLLVGLQLIILKSQIGQAAESALTDGNQLYRQWEAQAYTGAIMSLGAGVLISLFGFRHHTTGGRSGKNRPRDGEFLSPAVDLDSVSVRVFDVDDQDRSVEITPGEAYDSHPELSPTSPARLLPEDQDPDPGLEFEPPADPTETILRSIRAAAETDGNTSSLPRTWSIFRPLFLGRIFRRHDR